jgi:hypothetical protein
MRRGQQPHALPDATATATALKKLASLAAVASPQKVRRRTHGHMDLRGRAFGEALHEGDRGGGIGEQQGIRMAGRRAVGGSGRQWETLGDSGFWTCESPERVVSDASQKHGVFFIDVIINPPAGTRCRRIWQLPRLLSRLLSLSQNPPRHSHQSCRPAAPPDAAAPPAAAAAAAAAAATYAGCCRNAAADVAKSCHIPRDHPSLRTGFCGLAETAAPDLAETTAATGAPALQAVAWPGSGTASMTAAVE